MLFFLQFLIQLMLSSVFFLKGKAREERWLECLICFILSFRDSGVMGLRESGVREDDGWFPSGEYIHFLPLLGFWNLD